MNKNIRRTAGIYLGAAVIFSHVPLVLMLITSGASHLADIGPMGWGGYTGVSLVGAILAFVFSRYLRLFWWFPLTMMFLCMVTTKLFYGINYDDTVWWLISGVGVAVSLSGFIGSQFRIRARSKVKSSG